MATLEQHHVQLPHDLLKNLTLVRAPHRRTTGRVRDRQTAIRVRAAHALLPPQRSNVAYQHLRARTIRAVTAVEVVVAAMAEEAVEAALAAAVAAAVAVALAAVEAVAVAAGNNSLIPPPALWTGLGSVQCSMFNGK